MNIPLNIDFSQILLHLFNFTVLFAILYFLLYNPVKKFMEKREDYYKKIDERAKENLKKSEEIKKEYEEKLESVQEEIFDIKEKARNDADSLAKIKIEQAQLDADKIVADARENIERERKKMLSDTKNEISDIVTKAVEKIVTSSDTSSAYDEFLAKAKRSDSNE